jgi:putative transposase
MGQRRTAERIKRVLREIDRDLLKGLTVANACRKHGVSEPSFCRWRQPPHPAQPDEARQVKELSAEVERLKLLVADLLLDKTMLQEVAKKKW